MRWRGSVALALCCVAAIPQATAADVTVFAAASLKEALDEQAKNFTAATGNKVAVSYGASNTLAKQIVAGAPADIFISADLDWMHYLAEKSLIVAGSGVSLLGNEIILVAPKDSTVETMIQPKFPLARLLGDGRLAMADVKAVPAGKYGKAALESLGVWTDVEGRVAQAENVRAALKLVATGEAALGIVYATDAKAEPGVKVIGSFPSSSHPPIVYPAGLVAPLRNADAAAFMVYLKSPKAKAMFEAQGFTYLAAVAGN